MIQRISSDIERTVEQNQGIASLQGELTQYVMMTKAKYQEFLGLDHEESLDETMKAINEARADIATGRTRSLDEFATEFENRHGISR